MTLLGSCWRKDLFLAIEEYSLAASSFTWKQKRDCDWYSILVDLRSFSVCTASAFAAFSLRGVMPRSFFFVQLPSSQLTYAR